MGCRYSSAVAICCEGCCLCTRIDIAAALDDPQFRFSRCCAWMRRSWPWITVSDSLWSLDKLYMWTCKNHAPALRGTDPARRDACFPRIYYKNWRMLAFRGERERERGTVTILRKCLLFEHCKLHMLRSHHLGTWGSFLLNHHTNINEWKLQKCKLSCWSMRPEKPCMG